MGGQTVPIVAIFVWQHPTANQRGGRFQPVRIGTTRSMHFSGHVLNTFSPVFGHLCGR